MKMKAESSVVKVTWFFIAVCVCRGFLLVYFMSSTVFEVVLVNTLSTWCLWGALLQWIFTIFGCFVAWFVRRERGGVLFLCLLVCVISVVDYLSDLDCAWLLCTTVEPPT